MIIAYGIIGGLGAVIFGGAAFFLCLIAGLVGLLVLFGILLPSPPAFFRAAAKPAFWIAAMSILCGVVEIVFVWIEASGSKYNSPFNQGVVFFYIWRAAIPAVVLLMSRVADRRKKAPNS